MRDGHYSDRYILHSREVLLAQGHFGGRTVAATGAFARQVRP